MTELDDLNGLLGGEDGGDWEEPGAEAPENIWEGSYGSPQYSQYGYGQYGSPGVYGGYGYEGSGSEGGGEGGGEPPSGYGYYGTPGYFTPGYGQQPYSGPGETYGSYGYEGYGYGYGTDPNDYYAQNGYSQLPPDQLTYNPNLWGPQTPYSQNPDPGATGVDPNIAYQNQQYANGYPYYGSGYNTMYQRTGTGNPTEGWNYQQAGTVPPGAGMQQNPYAQQQNPYGSDPSGYYGGGGGGGSGSDWGPNQTGYMYSALGQNNEQFGQNMGLSYAQLAQQAQHQQLQDTIAAYTAQQNAAYQQGQLTLQEAQNNIAQFTANANAQYQQQQAATGQYSAETQRQIGLGNIGVNYAQLAQQQAQFGGTLGFQYSQLGQQGEQFGQNLGLQYAQLGQQGGQFGQTLGFNYAQLGQQAANQQAQNAIAAYSAQQNAAYQQGQLTLGERDRNIAQFTAQTQAQIGMGNLGVSQFSAQANAAYQTGTLQNQQLQTMLTYLLGTQQVGNDAERNAIQRFQVTGQLENEQQRVLIESALATSNIANQAGQLGLAQSAQAFQQGPQFELQRQQQAFTQALQAGQFGLAAQQQANDEQFRRAQLVSTLRGPENVYVEQAVLHGLNGQGISNAEAAINGTGGDVPGFERPHGQMRPVTYDSFMREMGQGQQVPNGTMGGGGYMGQPTMGGAPYPQNYAGGFAGMPAGYPPMARPLALQGASFGPRPGGAPTAPANAFQMAQPQPQGPMTQGQLVQNANDAQAAAQQAYYRANPTMPGGALYHQGPETPGTGGYSAFGGPQQNQAPPGYQYDPASGMYRYAAGAYRAFWDPRTGQTSANSGGANTEIGQHDWSQLGQAQTGAVRGAVGDYMQQHPNPTPEAATDPTATGDLVDPEAEQLRARAAV